MLARKESSGNAMVVTIKVLFENIYTPKMPFFCIKVLLSYAVQNLVSACSNVHRIPLYKYSAFSLPRVYIIPCFPYTSGPLYPPIQRAIEPNTRLSL